MNLIKGSSLAFLMTVKDVMAVGKIAASFGYNYIEAYLDAFLVYLILCTIIQLAYAGAERRLERIDKKQYVLMALGDIFFRQGMGYNREDVWICCYKLKMWKRVLLVIRC